MSELESKVKMNNILKWLVRIIVVMYVYCIGLSGRFLFFPFWTIDEVFMVFDKVESNIKNDNEWKTSNSEKQIEKKEGKVIFCVEDLEKQRRCKID